MPSITVNIARAGTMFRRGDTSAVSHMWFELTPAAGHPLEAESFGWSPVSDGAQAGRWQHDAGQKHLHKSDSLTLQISQAQYDRIRAFAQKPTAHGFSPVFDALTNNCIDYVWSALQAGGLTPVNFTGQLWPGKTVPAIGMPPLRTDNWRSADADTFVARLLRHSQALTNEFWNSAVQTEIRNSYASHWKQHWWRLDQLSAERRYDPLVLDLDGNGLSTKGLSSRPVLFDHDNDGIRTGTGWINPGAGLLVLDRNGNGTIDNGSELFGDHTPLAGGGYAADGFHALAQQDSNRDGMVDMHDSNWHQLQVWRDLNQDGISQDNELFTLAQAGIASLTVTGRPHLDTLFNGNQIADKGHYTNIDGSSGDMADINFAASNFFRQFADTIAVAPPAAQLPDAAGSGKVRDLRQAAMQSAALFATLTQYAAAPDRHQQRELLDQLLTQWAATAGMSSLRERIGDRYHIIWQTDDQAASAAGPTSTASAEHTLAREKKLQILEAFYGRPLFEMRTGVAVAVAGITVAEGNDGQPGVITINWPARQQRLFDQTYALLQESVYGTLLPQSRFRPLFDSVLARVHEDTVVMDFSAIERLFATVIAADRDRGLQELIDFYQFTTGSPAIRHWRADLMLARQLHLLTTSEKASLFTEFGISGNRRSQAINQILADARQRTFRGNKNRNLICGNAGENWLYGGEHHDLLDGNAGDDYLHGGAGDDIYLLRHGSGHDVVDNAPDPRDGAVLPADKLDTVIFDGVYTADIRSISFEFGDMILEYGEHDSVTIADGFADPLNEIDRFQFEDAVLNTSQLLNIHAIQPCRLSDDHDILSLSRHGDTVYAGDGNDVIDGDDGDDLLHGEDGNDLLAGGGGNDILDGGDGDDLLIGGAGNDLLITGSGADVLAFNRGHGRDTVATSAHSLAAISLGEGIAFAELAFEKNLDHLLLHTGDSEQIIFRDWYADASRRGVAALQMVTTGGDGSDPASLDGDVACFDFSALVSTFDKVRSAEPGLHRWQLSPALQHFRPGGSDNAILGGERAYRYARNETFLWPATSFDMPSASLSGFGQSAANLHAHPV
ncbi:calcium-binding protein [Herbaspirillum autotrophicum]|uniref:hypothetical protein n=1 Tax=Herbaspirillum autotrophicum TaxID=180195 RepID=UPI00067E42F0|nr:hypothetical protein [Herbaspirillum autotrophicum]